MQTSMAEMMESGAGAAVPPFTREYGTGDTEAFSPRGPISVGMISTRRSVPVGLDVHLAVDDYGTHKAEPVRKWLLVHPRFHPHVTPTGSSWLNLPGGGSAS
ncbi:hypothetical protein [Streptomyces sp. SP2-10]|uniref:hypothetical protein n=1 Tax=Streptomyces sp. SP2-10 TaxID=2873385 RepID=UPI001CA7113E|nr:hypothetical protein [Streptomyces sp. SP2-10]MBY8840588.1 hypothetical protein [Streptomyces sp. SP2-10]